MLLFSIVIDVSVRARYTRQIYGFQDSALGLPVWNVLNHAQVRMPRGYGGGGTEKPGLKWQTWHQISSTISFMALARP